MTRPCFDNSYARMPERFYARAVPTSAKAPRLIRANGALAAELGIDPEWLVSPEGIAFLAGQEIVEGSEPIAMAYAGHQFGQFVPQLGDGRAILLGEVIDREGRRRDIHLKGSGRTPFSRGGDGNAALGPVLREYVLSEAMAALCIPTTRALAAATTGQSVVREKLLPGAVIARVASSHIRVGTFQFFAARGDIEALRLLADHVIERHYPDADEAEDRYLALLEGVIAAQAELVARWLAVGFIHGVMNTDNMSVAGETIDYGPCAFMDAYDPATVFSSIDRMGRYAYGNQPNIALWNLTRFAETLLPLLADDQAKAVEVAEGALTSFPSLFQHAYSLFFRRKLGLAEGREGDTELIAALLEALSRDKVDFTLFFRKLSDAELEGEGEAAVRAMFADVAAFDEWLMRWRSRLQFEALDVEARAAAMRGVNPAFIPRNHRVEAMIRAAVDKDDFTLFEELLLVLSRPFDDQPDFLEYQNPPLDEERVLATFCGT
jgi:uncharacterized protein YdiU (UPF0061 family)